MNFSIFLILLLVFHAHSTFGMDFVYHGKETPNDQRYEYHWQVLKEALEATKSKYGKYSLKSEPNLSEQRQIKEISKPNGLINIMVLDAGSMPKSKILSIKIPLDKGLLGYRVFLIRKADQDKLSKVQTLQELKNQFKVGQGASWVDYKILKEAGFNVVGGNNYDGLFKMLQTKRFDLFPRGVTEVLDEIKSHDEKGEFMAIDKNFLIYYPMPVYFHFPESEKGLQMAKRVEEGLKTIIKNGLFDKLFMNEFKGLIEKLDLNKRKLFILENPSLSPDHPFNDQALWYSPS